MELDYKSRGCYFYWCILLLLSCRGFVMIDVEIEVLNYDIGIKY